MNTREKFTGDDFSLTESGLFYTLLRKIGLDAGKSNHLAKRSLILICLTWIPLAVLSALQNLFIGNRVDIPFIYDITTQFRFLVVIPLLVFAEKSVDFRLNEFIDQFFDAGIIDESDRPLYMKIRSRCKKLADSLTVDIIILAFIIINITIRWKSGIIDETTNWMKLPEGAEAGPSWAGAYFLIIGMPIVQFILLRWLWRWVIWFIFFLQISKLPLRLRAAHADEAGGIGFLGTPPGPFLTVTFAIATLFSSAILSQVILLNHKLPEYYVTMGAFVVLSIILNILPLFVFLKPLVACRRKAILEYSALITRHHQHFDEKWINSKEPESLLGNPDPSSTADINSVFQTIKSMKTMPFDIKTMASSIVISALPMLPLFALQYSVAEILQKVLKLLV
jgi:hypothetical protein